MSRNMNVVPSIPRRQCVDHRRHPAPLTPGGKSGTPGYRCTLPRVHLDSLLEIFWQRIIFLIFLFYILKLKALLKLKREIWLGLMYTKKPCEINSIFIVIILSYGLVFKHVFSSNFRPGIHYKTWHHKLLLFYTEK